MAKEVKILTWCDPCMSVGARIAATQTVIMSLSLWPKPLEIDVCDEHFDVIGAADNLVSKYGRVSESEPLADPAKRTKTGRKPGHDLAADPDSLGCPVCLNLYSGKGTTPTKYLAQHIRVQHAPQTIKAFTQDQIRIATAEARAKIVDHE